jgi:hypothetical protein
MNKVRRIIHDVSFFLHNMTFTLVGKILRVVTENRNVCAEQGMRDSRHSSHGFTATASPNEKPGRIQLFRKVF